MKNIIKVDARIQRYGIDVVVDGRSFPIKYPLNVWSAYSKDLKEVLKDNIALSSTYFVPQILDISNIFYGTARPINEAFIFKNGIFDMAASAHDDKRSSISYLKRFVNTTAKFQDNSIRVPKKILPARNTSKNDMIIPFTFGKDSLLSAAVAQEIGIRPHLVYYIEPSHLLEYKNKKLLFQPFARATGLKVSEVLYGPGNMRYGKFWNKNTELGWGLQTTEYAELSLPFADYYNAGYLALGNEHSCAEAEMDEEGLLTYWTAYDQHPDWTAQQGLLISLISGRKINVVSLVESLHEIAEIAILYRRYPAFAKFQFSCQLGSKKTGRKHWCENCEKCAVMFTFIKALGLDAKAVGFEKNLFDSGHKKLFRNLFFQNRNTNFYGVEEEVFLALYLSHKRGETGETIDIFKKRRLPKFKYSVRRVFDEYFSVHSSKNLPQNLITKLRPLYESELRTTRKKLKRLL